MYNISDNSNEFITSPSHKLDTTTESEIVTDSDTYSINEFTNLTTFTEDMGETNGMGRTRESHGARSSRLARTQSRHGQARNNIECTRARAFFYSHVFFPRSCS